MPKNNEEDLSFTPIEAIIEELEKRYAAYIFMGVQDTSDEESDTFVSMGGMWTTRYGLANFAVDLHKDEARTIEPS
jgi:hypothetical protein